MKTKIEWATTWRDPNLQSTFLGRWRGLWIHSSRAKARHAAGELREQDLQVKILRRTITTTEWEQVS